MSMRTNTARIEPNRHATARTMEPQTRAPSPIKDTRSALFAAKAHVGQLASSREAALVGTKIDEALLWLSQVNNGFGPANDALRNG